MWQIVESSTARLRDPLLPHNKNRWRRVPTMKRIARHKRRFDIPVPRAEEGVGYSVETAAQLTGIRPELIRYYCARSLISPVVEREPGNFIFDTRALCAMRRITILRHEHGLDFAAAQIVADLLPQIDCLSASVAFRIQNGQSRSALCAMLPVIW